MIISTFRSDRRLLCGALWVAFVTSGCGTETPSLSGSTEQSLSTGPTPQPTPCTYSGRVLVATGAGLNITDASFSSFAQTVTTTNGLPHNEVRHLGVHQGVLMAATPQGLVVFKNDCSLTIEKVVTTVEGLPSNDVKRIVNAPDGSLWVATGSGVGRSTDGGNQFQTIISAATPGLSSMSFATAGANYGSRFLFANNYSSNPVVHVVFSNGLCRSTDAGANFTCIAPSTITGNGNSNTVTGIVRLSSGRIVVSTGHKLIRSDDEGATWALVADAIGHNWCNGLSRNPSTDSLFVSTSGFSSYSSSGQATSFSNYGAGSGGTWATIPISNGQILIATVDSSKGLFVAQGEATLTTTVAYTTANGLLSNRVFDAIYLE
jgi:hypothetical protein